MRISSYSLIQYYYNIVETRTKFKFKLEEYSTNYSVTLFKFGAITWSIGSYIAFDHEALWFLNPQTLGHRQEYTISLQHEANLQNKVPDALSRIVYMLKPSVLVLLRLGDKGVIQGRSLFPEIVSITCSTGKPWVAIFSSDSYMKVPWKSFDSKLHEGVLEVILAEDKTQN